MFSLPELETFFSVNEQTRLFLISCLFGIPLGILFDIFRVIRTLFPHNTILVAVEDILYMMIYAVFMTAFTIVCARGDYRFFYTVGNILGFALYFFTAGNIIIGVIRKISGWIHAFFRLIFLPFRKIYGKISDKSKQLCSNDDNLKKNIKSP
jgi:spore cortex biosynthesis protein YabQ